jgi:hypothetical protein
MATRGEGNVCVGVVDDDVYSGGFCAWSSVLTMLPNEVIVLPPTAAASSMATTEVQVNRPSGR